jgi:glycosyltransferase involved in cell wall biosynthesis
MIEMPGTGEGIAPTRLIVLTSRYPYWPGEWFLDPELAILSHDPRFSIEIAPLIVEGIPRAIPSTLVVHSDFPILVEKANRSISARSKRVFRRFLALCPWIGRADGARSREQRKHYLAVLGQVESIRAILRQMLLNDHRSTILYAYWLSRSAMAAALLKKERPELCLVARTHGGDLYEARSPYGFFPLRRAALRYFDLIAPVSCDGLAWLAQIHPEAKLEVHRLGTPDLKPSAFKPKADTITLLSVSSAILLKRIDRIIDALVLIPPDFPYLIEWTHIGAGPELERLRESARSRLCDRVSFSFTGELPNLEIHRLIAGGEIDIFINSSESEGIPVSIMEAMSGGIPVIAPAVGGIAEIVRDRINGRLLSAACLPAEIAEAICEPLWYRSSEPRIAARATWESGYSAMRNYQLWADVLAEVAAHIGENTRSMNKEASA